MMDKKKSSGSFSLTNGTKGRPPRLPFKRIKNAVLGPGYNLSLVFAGDGQSRTLNRKYGGKDYIPDVLSFELDEKAGEIFINPLEARRQAPDFGKTYSRFVGHLYIHALVHLKGMEHGSKMERMEAELRKQFGF